jgi:peptidoglycan/xylan/chitin deacetylase (PgdA/CDA1 family)
MLKENLLNFLVKTDAFAAVRYMYRTKTPILMYHRFSHVSDLNATSAKTLTSHLNYLTKHYKIISLSELSKALISGEPIPANSAVITIDDGYRDTFEVAFPIFRQFNVSATLFVVTDFLDKKSWIWTDKARFILFNTTAETVSFQVNSKLIEKNFNDKISRLAAATKINSELKTLSLIDREAKLLELASLLKVEIPDVPTKDFESITWDEAVELDRNGVAIESHSVSHPILPLISADALKFELVKSKELIEKHLQRDVKLFCYPNGNHGQREIDAVSAAKYDSAVSTIIDLCENSSNKFALPRVDTEPEITRFIQSTSGFDSLKKRFL